MVRSNKFAKKMKSGVDTRGFTALELIVVLPLIIGLIILANSLFDYIARVKRLNQLADQIKVYRKTAVMYINDHYREMLLAMAHGGGVVMTPLKVSFAYLHQGTAVSEQDKACLVMLNPEANKLLYLSPHVYLLMQLVSLKLSSREFTTIANTIGGSAGVYQVLGGEHKITGLDFNNNLALLSPPQLAKQCGFELNSGSSNLPNNSLIIDLSRSKTFFAQLVAINHQNDNSDVPQNPSLQKTGASDAASMKTNLYLDAIITESKVASKSYCDTSDITSSANEVCNSFASSHNYQLVANSCNWYSDVLQGDGKCLATARGAYVAPIIGCKNANFGDAAASCLQQLETGEAIINGSARWSAPNLIDGNKCVAEASASYQGQDCRFPCAMYKFNSLKIPNCGDDVNALCQRLNPVSYPIPKLDHDNNLNGQMTGNGCYIATTCITWPVSYFATQGVIAPHSLGPSKLVNCNSKTVAAVTDDVDPLGYIIGGQIVHAASTKKEVIPPSHRYYGLNFGRGANGESIVLKSDAPPGVASDKSSLEIANAGISGSMLSVISHSVNFAEACSANELGKIVEEINPVNDDVEAQLQCSYSPIACSNGNYCYLPVKTASREYDFNQAVQTFSCQAPLVVMPEQPIDGLDGNVKCPDLKEQQLRLFENVHGEMVDCYDSNLKGVQFCKSYQSLCSYLDSSNTIVKYKIAGLKKLVCMAKSHIFVVNNYQQ